MSPRRRRLARLLAVVYLALLAASHAWRAARDGPPPPAEGERRVELAAAEVAGDEVRRGEPVRVALIELGPRDAPAVLLLHGSPGRGGHLRGLGERLARGRRVLIPTLPGFGASTRDVPDYSARAYADYALQLLDALGIERAHLVGHSLGGAVALRAADRAPERVRSTTLVDALGVVELELFGDPELNRLVHGAQLAAIVAAVNLTPHFGALDRFPLGVPYARSFYDTDQAPLRGCLERHDGPLLIVHGEEDFLVPPAAAREHHRLVPQSELVMHAGGHFTVFAEPARVAAPTADFLDRVEAGAAPRRADAAPARVAAAAAPFDPADVPPARGPALFLFVAIFALATLVSEDLTCIGAGLLVAQGRVDLLSASAGCLLGIFVGDVLLYLAGRLLGRPAIARRPLRWVLTEARVERASAWFRRHGVKAIFLSRLTPGLRLPTYFAAGLARTSFPRFAGYFLLAASLWTPLLVGFSAWAGERLGFDAARRGSLALFAALLLALFLAERVGVPLLTRRGRRLLRGALRRKLRWEYWPRWALYAPIVPYVAWLALTRRGLMTLGLVNPAMPLGGLVGESKARILAGLAGPEGAEPAVARFARIPAAAAPAERLAQARRFLDREGLAFPVVLKPDVGQRGEGVRILSDEAELEAALAGVADDQVLQEHVGGREFGVFYARRPGEPRGRVLSLADKRLPAVVGDGRRTLEELILDDERAVCLAQVHLDANAARLADVPAAGERVELGRLGTHCRGALFLDAARLATPALEARVDALSRGYEGFFFGRYDLRAPSEEHLARGEGLRVLELNGLSSEPAHVYDPRYSVLDAWRALARQWRLAYEIAEANRARGHRPPPFSELIAALRGHREDPSGPASVPVRAAE